MTEQEKQALVDIQLLNLCKLLGAELSRVAAVDSSLRKCKKYILTYDKE